MSNWFDFSELLLSGNAYALGMTDSNELLMASGPVGDMSVGSRLHLSNAYRGKTAELSVRDARYHRVLARGRADRRDREP